MDILWTAGISSAGCVLLSTPCALPAPLLVQEEEEEEVLACVSAAQQ